ncbi:MAG: glycosyltransferase [Anaerolineae bacterium]|nr:glycosyltransferase [Anaerolineae bacterium]
MTSEQEKNLIERNFPRYGRQIEIIPNCLNMSEYENIKIWRKPNTLIFTGPFKYYVNYEAMTWFVGKVFPLILKQVPDAQLIITGDHANRPLPSSNNVTLAGYVDDIKTLIASSYISIAPLLRGGRDTIKDP